MGDEQRDRIVERVLGLSAVQLDVVWAMIERFSIGFAGEHLIDDFLPAEAFDYFGTRLAAHHAYSSSVLKKENFEHVLEEAFGRLGVPAKRQDSMTVRGADLMVGGVSISLKTEAAKNLNLRSITISKLMEAAWIKEVRSRDDISGFIAKMVLPHFSNYDKIFILRSYPDSDRDGHTRYDLREIPKSLLEGIGDLTAADFSELTKTRTTGAEVWRDGRKAFKFRLDGSDDKLTITQLDVGLCPLHAWWSLRRPD